jgi:carboxypeptidase C (cathepsin A)
MATPFHGIELNMWHLAYDPVFTQRVEYGYYEAGHMMYIRPSAHKKLKADLATFITSTAGARPRTTPAQ